METHKDENGNIIYEDYLVQKPKGSTARAVMHGVLDVSSLGLWEVVGTPMEGHIGKKDKVAVRIHYNKDETVSKIEIVNGKLTLLDEPGIGVELDKATLKKYGTKIS